MPEPKNLGEAVVDLEVRSLVGVRRPHLEERQCQQVEDCRYVVSSHVFLTGSNDAFLVVVSKDLQEWDGIADASEEGIKAKLGAKSRPDGSMGILGFGSFWANSVGNRCLNSNEASSDMVPEFRWQACQDIVCGKVEVR